MRTRRGAVGWLILWTSSLLAQDGASLRIDGAGGAVAADFAECRCRLSLGPTAGGEERAFAVLGNLRLAHLDTARELLDASPRDDVDAACWAVVSHHWYLRTSKDTQLVQAHLPRLRDRLARASTRAGSKPATATFAEAALVPHAWFCLGDLLTACSDDTALAMASSRRAVELWLDLERQVWQPGRGHFRPRPTGGQILLPEPPDATVLAPAAAGLLVASGDHLERHLRTSLHDLLRRPLADVRAAAWVLAGAAQLGDGDLLDAAWGRQPPRDPERGLPSPGDAGRRLDAMLFAITGLRLATGAGVDARCTRLHPHLPPDHDHLTLHDLVADGARFDLDLAARDGDFGDDERDEVVALGQPPGPRLRVTITLKLTSDGEARSFLLQGAGLQYVVRLSVGDHVARTLMVGRR